MMALAGVEWLFAILILIVFINRYVFGTLLRFWDKRNAPEFSRDPVVWPEVAIIVPVFNEGSHVLQTAKSFSRLQYPADKLSIIFVDDCSSDDTYEYLQEVAKTWPWMQVSCCAHWHRTPWRIFPRAPCRLRSGWLHRPA